MKIICLAEDTLGANGCEAEHGLCIYIETKNHKILCDCGATDMFIRNSEKHKIDLKKIDTVILSHGHYDHSGGIIPFSKINQTAKIYALNTVGGEYYSIRENGPNYIGIDKNILNLPQFIALDGNCKIDDEISLFSGILSDKTNSRLKKMINGRLVDDDFLHEQCTVISDEDKQILISGCAHNGIVNILHKYRQIYSSYPDIVISGFHMIKSSPYTQKEKNDINSVGDILLDTGATFFTGHCTGENACAILKEKMGDKLHIMHSGDVLIPRCDLA